LLFLLAAPLAFACTRVVYLDPEDAVITALSMDWKVDVGTNLGIFAGNATKDFNPTQPFKFLGQIREQFLSK